MTENNSVNYNYGQVVTPFQPAGTSWQGPIATARVEAARWRLVCLLLLIINLLLGAIFVYKLMQPKQQVLAAAMLSNGHVVQVGTLPAVDPKNLSIRGTNK